MWIAMALRILSECRDAGRDSGCLKISQSWEFRSLWSTIYSYNSCYNTVVLVEFCWDCFVFKVVLTPWLHRKESHLRRRATARGVSGFRPHSTKGRGRRWCGMDVLGWVKPPTRLSYPGWDDMVLFPWVCVVAMFCLIVLLTAPGERVI